MESLDRETGVPDLGGASVHVWQLALSGVDAEHSMVLSDDEQARAERFVSEVDRDRFVASRGTLRLLISRYTSISAHDAVFTYNEYGKPALDGHDELSFNVSHSGDAVLFAFSAGRAVGVDVERMRVEFDFERIAARFFNEEEVSELAVLPSEIRRDAFYQCWTRKEAFVKARGQGLFLNFKKFRVSVGDPAELVGTEDADAGPWSIRDIDAGPGYKAALAVQLDAPEISCFSA